MKFFIGIGILILGIILMVINSSAKSSNFHYQLSDFYKKINDYPSSMDKKYLTLYGYVQEGSIKKKGIQASFLIIPQNPINEGKVKKINNVSQKPLNIFFNGKTLLPDTFKDGAQVSVEGYYNSETKIFESHKVLAKCASRYESSYPKKELY